MNLILFSDSHGKSEGMKLALERQPSTPEVLIFLGDGLRDLDDLPEPLPESVLRVRGNCDFYLESAPEESLISLEGHLLFFTHGNKYGVKGGVGAILAEGVRRGADIILFGHTHQPYSETVPAGETVAGIQLTRPVYLFNPGSIGKNEDGLGKAFGNLILTKNTVLFSHGRI